MISVSAGDGLVIIDLGGSRRDVLVSCAQAEALSAALREAAAAAGLCPPPLVRGEHWSAKVESFDGMVAIHFTNPDVGAPCRVPLPPAAAVSMADAIDWKGSQAKNKLRIVLQRGTG